jgi:ketol-acid reductoisomerase
MPIRAMLRPLLYSKGVMKNLQDLLDPAEAGALLRLVPSMTDSIKELRSVIEETKNGAVQVCVWPDKFVTLNTKRNLLRSSLV